MTTAATRVARVTRARRVASPRLVPASSSSSRAACVARAIAPTSADDADAEEVKVDARELREVFNESIAAMRTVTPPFAQEGMEEKKETLSEYDVETLVKSDTVFNAEMSWLAFNWRVLALSLIHI